MPLVSTDSSRSSCLRRVMGRSYFDIMVVNYGRAVWNLGAFQRRYCRLAPSCRAVGAFLIFVWCFTEVRQRQRGIIFYKCITFWVLKL